MAGRRPLPTQTKLLSGKRSRPLNLNEPKFKLTVPPSCPEHLDAIAKAEWDRVYAELLSAGLLTAVDRAALSAYCAAWSRWVNAEENIQKFGTVIKSPKSGFPIQNPYVGVANTALDQMRKFLVEFGMTPSSRSRISVAREGSDKDADPFAAFMRSIGGEDITINDDKEIDICTTGD
jgi:P27 family predicted phage terminase small subunit